ncbi:MAG: hypothetical protein KDB14_25330 [Planctomycetales bacterium]|nr:hypothetical protein [Planctomycetales bacterium]
MSKREVGLTTYVIWRLVGRDPAMVKGQTSAPGMRDEAQRNDSEPIHCELGLCSETLGREDLGPQLGKAFPCWFENQLTCGTIKNRERSLPQKCGDVWKIHWKADLPQMATIAGAVELLWLPLYRCG